MTCPDAREWLSALVDDALTPTERAAVEAHVASCADCRRELEGLRKTVALLRAVEPARAPVGFVDRVLSAARPVPWYRRLLRRLFVPLRVKLPIEAAAVALIAVSAVYLFQRSPELQQAARHDAPLSRFADAPGTASPKPAPTTAPEPAPATPPGARSATPSKPLPSGPPTPPPSARLQQVPPSRDQYKERAAELREAAPRTLEAPAEPELGFQSSRAESAGLKAGRETEAPATAGPRPLAKGAGVGGVAVPPAAERDAGVAEEKAESAPSPSVHRFSARALISVDVSGRLSVKDRQAAGAALAELIARLGGTQLARRPDPAAAAGEVVELLIPRAAYAEFTEGLRRLGEWRPDTAMPELPELVRAVVRLTD